MTGDAGRLSQILITLVRASIDRLERGEISVNVENEPNYPAKIKFSVTDNGRRIPPEKLSRIFDDRLDDENAMPGESELSLVLARYLARMMGATCGPRLSQR